MGSGRKGNGYSLKHGDVTEDMSTSKWVGRFYMLPDRASSIYLRGVNTAPWSLCAAIITSALSLP